ncbi:MAG: S41 family peptidase [Anaerolineae bacterium]
MRVATIFVGVAIVLALMALSFVGGVVVTAQTLQGDPSRVLAASSLFVDGHGAQPPAEETDRFKVFWEAWRIAHDHYVDATAVNDERMTRGAIQGMLDALGDQGHTRFMTAAEAERQSQVLSGVFVGIGAEITHKDGKAVVVTPLEGSPAEGAGVKTGDIVLSVDGEDIADHDMDEVLSHLRGAEGADVRVRLLRPSTGDTLDLTITRARILVPTVTWQMLPGTKIADIRLSQFGMRASAELQRAVDAARAAGADGLILDLRNNPGGLLNEAVFVTSQFIDQGNVLIQRDREGHEIPYSARPGGRALDLPMVVLVNQGTASASEITAGALQYAGRARLVGQTTFGTGTVLSSFKLSDGSALLLGTGEWLTPGGRMIRRQGIEPDIHAELPANIALLTPASAAKLSAAELRATSDTQLLAGLQVVEALTR